MKILQELAAMNDSGLTEEIMKHIQKLILTGAKNRDQKWANALELVHYAYNEVGQPYPSPDEKEDWKQYEENISYAVKELAKYRGLRGDWRMSSFVFNEAVSEDHLFEVTYISGKERSKSWLVQAKSIEDLSNMVRQARKESKAEKGLRVRHKEHGDKIHINFWVHNIRQPDYVEVIPKSPIKF